jgi:hypothetical protein
MMRAIVEAAMTVSLIEGLCIALNSRVKIDEGEIRSNNNNAWNR